MDKEQPDLWGPLPGGKPFHTVLVANRGEIACRVIRTLRRLGIRSVAVYSDADAGARHVLEADSAVRLGPASPSESYLNIEAIVAACRSSGAQAVHPGYGFLSENAGLARALEEAAVVFIGPGIQALAVMGNKISAKTQVERYGVPVVPGSAEPGLDDRQLASAAAAIGFPVMVKPAAGGGGKGMRIARRPEELADALLSARRIARGAFGDDSLFLERLIERPRHIEVQILADSHNNVIHLGERECSLQRRHQKVIEEAPSMLLDAHTRNRIGEAACQAARSVNYTGAGTVEFLVSDAAPDEFFFMEMNTRLQVEHPVTELVTGIDLVEWQVRIAAGEKLSLTQHEVALTGHAVEARIYAETPEQDFRPSAGTVLLLREPSGPGIRIDGSLQQGGEVPEFYDPLISKIIAWGQTRAIALDRLDTALAGSVIFGIDTNTEYLRLLLNHPEVRAGRLDTTLIARMLPDLQFREVDDVHFAVAAAAWLNAQQPASSVSRPWNRRDGFRLGERRPFRLRLELEGGDSREVSIRRDPCAYAVKVGTDSTYNVGFDPAGGVVVDGIRGSLLVHVCADQVWLGEAGWSARLRRLGVREALAADAGQCPRTADAPNPQVRSTMPGTVVSVSVADGEAVAAGQILLTVEAMKMEQPLTAPLFGTVSITLQAGDLVTAGQIVATIQPADLSRSSDADPAAGPERKHTP